MIRVVTPSPSAPRMTTYLHMTALAARYEPGTGRRFGQKGSRKAHMNQLRERIERGEYTVDPDAVAAAIIRAHSRASAQPQDRRASARPARRLPRDQSK
jgi:Anti-sigma-28 factor, FlgM